MIPTPEQFAGCLLGLAVADAVAAPWEGITADLIYEMGPADRIVAHDDGETIYYTDDTQMMVGVVETLVECGHIDPDFLAARFVANYHPDRGYGQGARQMINAMGNGKSWRTVAAAAFGGAGSLGNGAAMRVAPIGVYFARDLQVVLDQAAKSARPTHQHPLGIDGARLIALAAALAARSSGAPLDRQAFLSALRASAQTEEFQWQLELAQSLRRFQSLGSFGNSLEAHRSVVTSIVCFADSPDSFADAVGRAIGQGNDVDTLAAMTGALAGARLGTTGIPRNLIDCLEDNHQGRSYLLGLANRLAAREPTNV